MRDVRDHVTRRFPSIMYTNKKSFKYYLKAGFHSEIIYFHYRFLASVKPTPTGCASWKVVLLVITTLVVGGGATYGVLYILDDDSSSSDSSEQSSGNIVINVLTSQVVNQFYFSESV